MKAIVFVCSVQFSAVSVGCCFLNYTLNLILNTSNCVNPAYGRHQLCSPMRIVAPITYFIYIFIYIFGLEDKKCPDFRDIRVLRMKITLVLSVNSRVF